MHAVCSICTYDPRHPPRLTRGVWPEVVGRSTALTAVHVLDLRILFRRGNRGILVASLGLATVSCVDSLHAGSHRILSLVADTTEGGLRGHASSTCLR